jgi:hypothetical protein
MQTESQDEQPADEVREARAIAKRALSLFAVVGLALGAPKAETVSWLRSESLWDELSPEEVAFVTAPVPTERQSINASWRSEALLMLLWSLGSFPELPGLNEPCNAGEFQALLPPFADISVDEFLASARCRTDAELIEMADSLLNAHWRARDARIHNGPMPSELDIGIIQERHHAINWVIGYDGLSWDEVTTDT